MMTNPVYIVGAGIYGLTTAVLLLERGQDVTLIDKHDCTHNASSHNAGQLLPFFHVDTENINAPLSKAQITLLRELPSIGTSVIKSIIEKYQLNCDFRSNCYIQMDLSKSHNAHLINAQSYIKALAHLVIQLGGKILANLEVTAIKIQQDQYEIQTISGTIVASRLVIATNDNSLFSSPFNQPIYKALTYLLVSKPFQSPMEKAIDVGYSQANNMIHYYRYTHDNRLILGCHPNVQQSHSHSYNNLSASLMQLQSTVGNFDIECVSYQYITTTISRLPQLGCFNNSLFYIQGCAGKGLSIYSAIAQFTSDCILGEHEHFHILSSIQHDQVGKPQRDFVFHHSKQFLKTINKVISGE